MLYIITIIEWDSILEKGQQDYAKAIKTGIIRFKHPETIDMQALSDATLNKMLIRQHLRRF